MLSSSSHSLKSGKYLMRENNMVEDGSLCVWLSDQWAGKCISDQYWWRRGNKERKRGVVSEKDWRGYLDDWEKKLNVVSRLIWNVVICGHIKKWPYPTSGQRRQVQSSAIPLSLGDDSHGGLFNLASTVWLHHVGSVTGSFRGRGGTDANTHRAFFPPSRKSEAAHFVLER